jgi:cold shock CspA family protein
MNVEQTVRGIVTSARFTDSTGFGFILSEHGDNVFFGWASTQGVDFSRGDEVKFIPSTKQDPRGKAAYRVFLVKRAVETDEREQITRGARHEQARP